MCDVEQHRRDCTVLLAQRGYSEEIGTLGVIDD